jgi:putative oxygen-independent coproporphyrinogen III oxidase
MAFGVYVHWPFCASKCPYCDFNSHVHATIDESIWRESYKREITYTASLTQGRTVNSIFFGGGTPSLMSPETVQSIISDIQSNWYFANDIEITLEANPTSVESKKFDEFRKAGVNRVSLGVQSLREKDLKFLGRTHDTQQAIEAINIAKQNFDRFSFDLIYARPEQSINDWKDELNHALELTVSHLSLYQLTIEKQTPFYTQYHRGEFKIPDQDYAADLYDVTQEILNEAGLPSYEVSNHARAGEESKHNLIYWRSGDYAGIGPGAHGRLNLDHGRVTTRAHRAPDIWLNRVREFGHGFHEFETLSDTQNFEEILMMGLRINEGVCWSKLNRASPEKTEALKTGKALQKLVNEGYLISDSERLLTSPEGLKRLNAILGYILT